MTAGVSQVDSRVITNRCFLLVFFLSLWTSDCRATELISDLKPATEKTLPVEINEPNDGRMTQKPNVENLGSEIYRIGTITVDKAKRLIKISGKMIPHEENTPIEFLATINQGFKSYESVLMLDANAFEFNLACIFIGLDSKNSSVAKYHFDPDPVEGDRVSISVGWQKNDQWIERDVVDLLKVDGEKPAIPSIWSYTGSRFIEGERYLAQMDGVIIGLIHDPASIIEHREGVGNGNWGSIVIDSKTAPPGGQEIVLKVQGLN